MPTSRVARKLIHTSAAPCASTTMISTVRALGGGLKPIRAKQTAPTRGAAGGPRKSKPLRAVEATLIDQRATSIMGLDPSGGVFGFTPLSEVRGAHFAEKLRKPMRSERRRLHALCWSIALARGRGCRPDSPRPRAVAQETHVTDFFLPRFSSRAAQLLVGRFAMLGFVAGLTNECLTGCPILRQARLDRTHLGCLILSSEPLDH